MKNLPERIYLNIGDEVPADPLSDRLTAEEKERVRTKYNAAKIGATEFDSPECADLMDILEDIFGADFFKEEE